MKHVQVTFVLTDDLGLKSAIIGQNDTDLPSDSRLLKRLAGTLLKSISLNDEDLQVQDLLGEHDIEKPKCPCCDGRGKIQRPIL